MERMEDMTNVKSLYSPKFEHDNCGIGAVSYTHLTCRIYARRSVKMAYKISDECIGCGACMDA